MITNALRVPADEYTGPAKEWFLGEEWHERDLEAIFRPKWLIAGHLDELDADPSGYGYITYSLGREQVLIRRDENGVVCGYHNFAHIVARSCARVSAEPFPASGSSVPTTPGPTRPPTGAC
jgi:hypothetical protein